MLLQDKLVIFLHLLGCDTNGHAHRPYSPIYLKNVNIVDRIAERVFNLVESYFNDNRTAYIFTADHGMSDKGSHGDGHPSNTDTPLVAWGAGIKNPKRFSHSNQSVNNLRFVDDHKHDMPTPNEWVLTGFERVDVNQADIAPLMATLVGLPCPVNSVGFLPLDYLNLNLAEEVEAVLANSKQILAQFLRKSYLKQSNSLYFKPFMPLLNYSFVLSRIEELISGEQYQTAMMYAQDLRSMALDGLHYFQTYDWLMLMTIITLGYIGWMVNLILHVMQSYTDFSTSTFLRKNQISVQCNNMNKGYLGGGFLMCLLSSLLYIEKSPFLYHAYLAVTVFLWTRIFCGVPFSKAVWIDLFGRIVSFKLTIVSALAVFILECLVKSFFERKMYTWFFLTAGILSAAFMLSFVPRRPLFSIFMCLTCWFLSIFTMMPAEIPENTHLVIAGGALVMLIGVSARWFDCRKGGKLMSEIAPRRPTFPLIFHVQVLLVALSSVMVWQSTSHRSQEKELLMVHQLINWSLAGISLVLPLASPTGLLERLSSIFLGFAPPFLLLSIGYEAIFYGALALVLFSWILVESTIFGFSEGKERNLLSENPDDKTITSYEERSLQLSDIRIPLIFMVLFNVAFFGTGNFASIASFEISSVYRFITVFRPFLMAALLIFKLFIPFVLVICVFSAITKLIRIPRLGCYFLVILFSDVMTIHFFFLVRNTGSWMEIGNSISHFGIMSAQVVFILLLFALTNVYTKDIVVGSPHFSSLKAT